MSQIIANAIDVLKVAAADLERIQSKLTMPVEEGLDIKYAFARLAVVCGKDTHLSIGVDFDNLNTRHGEGKLVVKWTVYNGSGTKHHFEGPTLADAVNACLAEHTPAKEGDAQADMIYVRQELDPLPL